MATYIQSEGGKGGQNGLNYLATDLLGSITAIVPAGNGTIEYRSYDAWGRLRNPDDWTYNNVSAFSLIDRGYTFHEHLPEFGLINMNGRMYDPLVARFLSPDPYVQDDIAGSQGFNRYSYCFNNPLKYTDPTGEMVPYYSNGSNVIYFPDDVDGVWMHEGYRVPMTGGGDVFGARIGEEWEYYENIGSYVSYRSRETGEYLNHYEGSYINTSSKPWSSNVFEFGCPSYDSNSSHTQIAQNNNLSFEEVPASSAGGSISIGGSFALLFGAGFETGYVWDGIGNSSLFLSVSFVEGIEAGIGVNYSYLLPGTSIESLRGVHGSMNLGIGPVSVARSSSGGWGAGVSIFGADFGASVRITKTMLGSWSTESIRSNRSSYGNNVGRFGHFPRK